MSLLKACHIAYGVSTQSQNMTDIGIGVVLVDMLVICWSLLLGL